MSETQLSIKRSDEKFTIKDPKHAVIVLIDVLRASSFIAMALFSQAKEVMVIKEEKEARTLKKKNPDCILAGERSGVPLPGFDNGNNPATIGKIGKNKKIILTSGNFCNVVNQLNMKKVPLLAGGIVNASFIAKYLIQKKFKEIYLIPTGAYRFKGETFKKPMRTEDDLLGALLIASKILKTSPEEFKSKAKIKKLLQDTMYANYLLTIDHNNANKKDIAVCGSVDIAPCVPILKKKVFILK